MNIFQKIKNCFKPKKEKEDMSKISTINQAVIRKNDGQTRTMRYLPLNEMAQRGILPKSVKSTDEKNLKPSQTRVWDFDREGIRTLDNTHIQGSVATVPFTDTEFQNFQKKHLL